MKRSLLVFLLLTATAGAFAQGRGGGGRGAPPTGKAAAPFDHDRLLGFRCRRRLALAHVSDQRDYGAAPLNADARKIADSWDPAKDAAAGEQCKGYAAPVVMRVPGRLHVTWQDDQTLKIETDAGSRRGCFISAIRQQAQAEGWQGVSKAEWDPGNAGAGGLLRRRTAAAHGRFAESRDDEDAARLCDAQRRAIQRNATLTEYYDLIKERMAWSTSF